MLGKKGVRVALDVLLTFLIVFEMLVQYTGMFLHEVFGFAFFATIIAHMALSASWMKATARSAKVGRMSGRQKALAIMGALLGVTAVVLGVSSIAISGLLMEAGFAFPLGSYALWATVHAVSAYALAGLVAIHLAMHWAFLAKAFKVPYNPARRQAISTGVHAVAAVGAVALGVSAVKQLMPVAALQAQAVQTTEAQQAADGMPPVSDSSATVASPGASATSQSASAASTAASSGEQVRQGSESGRGKGTRTRENSGSASSSSQAAAVSNTAPSSAYGANEEPAYAEEASEPATVTGTCTLCPKHCPLSDPKCNKPYAAGLI